MGRYSSPLIQKSAFIRVHLWLNLWWPCTRTRGVNLIKVSYEFVACRHKPIFIACCPSKSDERLVWALRGPKAPSKRNSNRRASNRRSVVPARPNFWPIPIPARHRLIRPDFSDFRRWSLNQTLNAVKLYLAVHQPRYSRFPDPNRSCRP